MCFGCGMTTNTYYAIDNEKLEKLTENNTALMNDLKIIDEDRGLIWYPSVLNMGEKGIIYPDGKVNDWYWNYAKVIDVPENEREKYDGHDKRLDLENAEILNENTRYLLSIPNLNKEYRNKDKARFKLYVRPKDWSPTIYTVATTTPETTVIHSASYEICRSIDGLKIIPHDTGSNLTTRLSYNVSGNYFDLDMSCFEPGYDYDIKFAFYDEYLASWNHQPYEFKFKVRKDEY